MVGACAEGQGRVQISTTGVNTVNDTTDLTNAILSLVEQKQPIAYRSIVDNEVVDALAVNEKQSSNVIYKLKKRGELTQDRDGMYVIVDDESDSGTTSGQGGAPAVAPPPPSSPPPRTQVPAVAPPALPPSAVDREAAQLAIGRNPGQSLSEALTAAEVAAQDALDVYVWSVADHEILEALMATRDSARRAREAMA